MPDDPVNPSRNKQVSDPDKILPAPPNSKESGVPSTPPTDGSSRRPVSKPKKPASKPIPPNTRTGDPSKKTATPKKPKSKPKPPGEFPSNTPQVGTPQTKRPYRLYVAVASAMVCVAVAAVFFLSRDTAETLTAPDVSNSGANTPSAASPATRVGTTMITFDKFADQFLPGRTSQILKSRSLETDGYRLYNEANPHDPLDPNLPGVPYPVSISQNPLPDEDQSIYALDMHFKGRKVTLSRVDGESFDLLSLQLFLARHRPNEFTLTGFRGENIIENISLSYTSFKLPIHEFELNWTGLDRVVLDAYQKKGGAVPKIVSLTLQP